MKSIPIRNYTGRDHLQKIQRSCLIADYEVKRQLTAAKPTGHHDHLTDRIGRLAQHGSPYFERRRASSYPEAHERLASGFLFASWHPHHRAISSRHLAALRKQQGCSGCQWSKPQTSQSRLRALSILL